MVSGLLGCDAAIDCLIEVIWDYTRVQAAVRLATYSTSEAREWKALLSTASCVSPGMPYSIRDSARCNHSFKYVHETNFPAPAVDQMTLNAPIPSITFPSVCTIKFQSQLDPNPALSIHAGSQ